MIEETGIVVALEGEHAWLETQAKSACGHCSVGKSCGTSLLARWFGSKRNSIQVVNHLGLQQGDTAVIGVSNELLIKSAFMVYMLPLIMMIMTATVISAMGANNAMVATSSLLGLLAGFLTMRWLNQNTDVGTVTLVRKVSPINSIPLETNITERGKSYE